MKRRLLVGVFVVAVVLGLVSVPKVRALLTDANVHILNSSGSIVDGIASALTGLSDMNVHVIDDGGHIVDSFGGAASVLCATGTVVYGQGLSTPAVCSTTTWPNALTTGDILDATSTNTVGVISAGTAKLPLVANGAGVASTYQVLPVAGGGNGAGTIAGVSMAGGGTTAGTTINPHNTLLIWCEFEPAFTVQSKFYIGIGTLDASDLQDVCLYSFPAAFGAGTSSTATLVTDSGALNWPASGNQTFAPLQNAGCTGANAPSNLCTGSGTGTLPTLPLNEPAGYYCLAATSNSTTAKVNSSNVSRFTVYSANSAATTSGECPTTVSSLTITPAMPSPFQWAVY